MIEIIVMILFGKLLLVVRWVKRIVLCWFLKEIRLNIVFKFKIIKIMIVIILIFEKKDFVFVKKCILRVFKLKIIRVKKEVNV